jgi:8-oxo-dGTP diphosphatase
VTSTIEPFLGAKAALFLGADVLTLQRDDLPHLPWPGHWDLPGGGREGCEVPEDCLLRELHEEFGLRLPPDRLVWRRAFPAATGSGRVWFFAGHLQAAEVADIRFGNEGQGWRLMPVAEFLAHPRAVAHLQDRTRIARAELG